MAGFQQDWIIQKPDIKQIEQKNLSLNKLRIKNENLLQPVLF